MSSPASARADGADAFEVRHAAPAKLGRGVAQLHDLPRLQPVVPAGDDALAARRRQVGDQHRFQLRRRDQPAHDHVTSLPELLDLGVRQCTARHRHLLAPMIHRLPTARQSAGPLRGGPGCGVLRP